MTGLSANIFKSSLGDCTNNGFSSTRDDVIVFSEDIERGNISLDEVRDDYLVIVGGPYGTVRAIPKSLLNSEYMFGGNFVYTSDSRFSKLNNGNPIKIFDRVERRR